MLGQENGCGVGLSLKLITVIYDSKTGKGCQKKVECVYCSAGKNFCARRRFNQQNQ